MKPSFQKFAQGLVAVLFCVAAISPMPVSASTETSYQVINYMPQLPNLPQYTGNYKILRSVIMPQSWGGATYGISFETREPAQMVFDWYADALRGEKWSVDTKAGNGRIDAANKKGNLVRVHVSSNGAGDMRSLVMIEYRIVKAVAVDGDDERSDEENKERR